MKDATIRDQYCTCRICYTVDRIDGFCNRRRVNCPDPIPNPGETLREWWERKSKQVEA